MWQPLPCPSSDLLVDIAALLLCLTLPIPRSDLSCCGEKHSPYYGEDDGDSGFGSGLLSPTLKIGTCDWDVNLYRDRAQPADTSFNGNEAKKLGSAWATCYLTAAAEYCGTDLLCDKMVLTFRGGIYVALVSVIE